MKTHYATFYTYSINETLKGIFQTLLREMSNDLSTGMLKTEQRQKKDNEIKGTISWVKYAILYATFLRKTIFKNDPNSN